ncbi:MAG: ABC transporter permease subunit [Alphaproteobacteria bacterium]|nr:ABC transporter permease subunit [Alphaproteobacteria bacterium]
MLRYAVERLILMVPALIAISALIFFVIQLPPGDYLSNQIAELQAQHDTAAIAKAQYLRHEHGLDRPVIEQFGMWIGVWPGPRGFSGLLQGDWGWSFEFSKPVGEVVDYALGPTIAVNVLAVFVVYLLAMPLGILAGVQQDKFIDYVVAAFAYVALATPGFLLALLVLTYSHRWFGLSIGGLVDPDLEGAPLSATKIASIAAHLGVAVVVIAFSGVGQMIRRLRANLLDELRKPYVTAARARGISETRLLLRYPVRLAMIPFIADIGNLLPSLVSGSVIVSVVLSLPTIGPILVRALQSQDQFLAGFILLFAAVLTLLGTLVSDLLLGFIDPRVRLGQGADR